MDQQLGGVLRQVSPDLPDVVEGESTRPQTAAMWAVRESSSSMVTPRFLAEDEGVTVADPRVIERSWEMDGLAGMMRSLVFGEVQLEVVLGHPGGDVCEAGLNPG